MGVTLRPRRGRINNHFSRSRIRDEYVVDYVSGRCYHANIPAHEGRFREAILKAERDVASTAAGNRGHEKPGTAARQTCRVAWSLRAGPGNGDGGGTWADNATAERREACLPVAREGSCLASVASRVTARHVQGWTSLGAPPIPSLGGRQRRRWKGRKKNPDAKRAGTEEDCAV
jgi:hypothetical protein